MKPKIIFVRTDTTASAYYRLWVPCQALKAKGRSVLIDEVDYDDFERARILIFQRQSNVWAIEEILKWKKKGKKIVFDFDDNIFELDPDNPALSFYTPEVYERMKYIVNKADAVTVSTAPLKDVFSEYNKNVFVLPNSLTKTALEQRRKKSDAFIIGWQGGGHHKGDLRLVKSAINYLESKYDFEFILAGSDFREYFKRALFRPWLKFSENLTYFNTFNDFSIGLCPLRNSPFSESKSDLKFLEYSALGIPTVASKETPYRSIAHGKTGFLARNTSDWERYVGDLIKDSSLREDIGRAAKEYVTDNRTIESSIGLWEEVYDGL